MTDSPFECVLDIRASLGECALWSVEDRALYWCDINAPSINRFDSVTRQNVAMPMPASVGSFALRSGGGFVAALRDGIWMVDKDGRLERKIVDAPYDPDHHRFNDGRCDRQGRFYVGSMNENRDASSAALYRLDHDLSFTQVLDDMTISNGLSFSPDGRVMYHADTPTHTVKAFDYDPATAAMTRRPDLVRFNGETDRPDGATVDAEGCYWSAFFRGGKVVRVSPEGRLLAEYPVPAMCPTMCALGGPRMTTLFVTSARVNRAEEELARLPQSGSIFAMEVGVPGVPEPRFPG